MAFGQLYRRHSNALVLLALCSVCDMPSVTSVFQFRSTVRHHSASHVLALYRHTLSISFAALAQALAECLLHALSHAVLALRACPLSISFASPAQPALASPDNAPLAAPASASPTHCDNADLPYRFLIGSLREI
jgi:hypothetical protein